MIDIWSQSTILSLCVLSTIICWGAGGIYDKIALRYAPPYLVFACLNTFSIPTILISLVVLCQTSPGWNITYTTLFWTFLASSSYTIGIISYLLAMTLEEASLVLGVTASYPVVLQFIAAHFLNEPIVPARLMGSILVATGVAAIGFSRRQDSLGAAKGFPLRLIVLIVMATLLWGVYGIFDKFAVIESGSGTAFLGKCMWDMIFLLAFTPFMLTKFRYFSRLKTGSEDSSAGDIVEKVDVLVALRSSKLWIPAGVSAICLYIGSLTYMQALSKATASYVIAITGCYPIVMYIMAVLLLKEPFNKLRLIGIILVTTGGILTQTTSAH